MRLQIEEIHAGVYVIRLKVSLSNAILCNILKQSLIMRKPRLSRHQDTEPVQKSPTPHGDLLKVRDMNASTAALLVGAGAVAIIVPVGILSLILFLIGA
jgi:hypothetical protein